MTAALIAPTSVAPPNQVAPVFKMACAFCAASEGFQKIPKVSQLGKARTTANIAITPRHRQLNFR